MDLEQNQRLHDLGIQLMANVSASNDHAQIPNDANEVLIRGATVMANGRSMGLNDDQTLRLAEMTILNQAQDAFGTTKEVRNPIAEQNNITNDAITQELRKRFM